MFWNTEFIFCTKNVQCKQRRFAQNDALLSLFCQATRMERKSPSMKMDDMEEKMQCYVIVPHAKSVCIEKVHIYIRGGQLALFSFSRMRRMWNISLSSPLYRIISQCVDVVHHGWSWSYANKMSIRAMEWYFGVSRKNWSFSSMQILCKHFNEHRQPGEALFFTFLEYLHIHRKYTLDFPLKNLSSHLYSPWSFRSWREGRRGQHTDHLHIIYLCG